MLCKICGSLGHIVAREAQLRALLRDLGGVSPNCGGPPAQTHPTAGPIRIGQAAGARPGTLRLGPLRPCQAAGCPVWPLRRQKLRRSFMLRADIGFEGFGLSGATSGGVGSNCGGDAPALAREDMSGCGPSHAVSKALGAAAQSLMSRLGPKLVFAPSMSWSLRIRGPAVRAAPPFWALFMIHAVSASGSRAATWDASPMRLPGAGDRASVAWLLRD